MPVYILLLVCLQLLSTQAVNESKKLYAELSESAMHSTGRSESESQSSVGWSSSTHTGNTAESETRETTENLNKYPSSNNPKKVTMVTGNETNIQTSESFISTTALATTVTDLMISTGILTKPFDPDTTSIATPGVSVATDQIQESISGPFTNQMSMGNCCLQLDNFTKRNFTNQTISPKPNSIS